MKKKPNILVITKKHNQLHRYQFKNITNKYNFSLFVVDLDIDIYIQINDFLKCNKKDFDGLISIIDDTCQVASLIAEKLNLFYSSPQAIASIQNKSILFSKLKNKEYISPFEKLNDDISKLNFPLYIKPSRGTLSQNSQKIIRKNQLKIFYKKSINLPKMEKSFFQKFAPENIESFLVQEYIDFPQYTLEGYVLNNNPEVIAITESIFDKNGKSFISFNFPKSFNKKISSKVNKMVTELINLFNFKYSVFNVEFFLDKKNSKIYFIELNTRQSPEFETLYKVKYKTSLTEMALQVSLGNKPNLSTKKTNQMAISFISRKYQDFLVEKLPSKLQIEKIRKKYKIQRLEIFVEKNQKLSDLRQDSFSFRYAIYDIHGNSEKHIKEVYKQARKELDSLITFSPVSH
ncbi:MAG: ATP-grasp domain-containing protein [Candidatus Pacebacteria bacterium]|nr:ATP-grasp domain-containing protein [Candidatus Paceibacterota bacterium]